MDDFAQSIAEAAEDAVAVCEHLRGDPLDYSEGSLAMVDEILTEGVRSLQCARNAVFLLAA
jgi:hypothetical protein